MLDQGINVVKVSQQTEYGRDLERTEKMRVEFYVDKHGPFIERFDKDGYSSSVRDERLNALARDLRMP